MGFLDTTWDLNFTTRKAAQRAEGDADFMAQYLQGEQGPPTPEQEAKGAVGNADVNAYKQQAERVGTAENMTGKDPKVGGTKPAAFSRDPDAPVPLLGVQGNIQMAPGMFPGADALMGGPYGAVGTISNVFKGMAFAKAKGGPIAKIVEEAKGAVPKAEVGFEEVTKVRDANGPIPVYHGTGHASPLDPENSRSGNVYGKGAYFTTNPEEASTYSFHGTGDPNVRRVFLDIRKPFDMGRDGVSEKLRERILGELKGFDSSLIEGVRKTETNSGLYHAVENIFGNDHTNEFLKRLGFDGIKADNHYVAFNADQIINAIGKGPKAKAAAEVAVDFDRITTVDDAAQAVDELATQRAKLNEADAGAGNGTGGNGGNGLYGISDSGGNKPPFAVGAKPIPDADAYAAAETLGMTPEEMAARQRGAGLDVEHQAAYNTMVVQARLHLEQTSQAEEAGYLPEGSTHTALAKLMLVAKAHEKAGTEEAQALRIRGMQDVKEAVAFADSLEGQIAELHGMVPSGAVLSKMIQTAGATAVVKTAKSASELGKDMFTSLLYFSMLSGPETNIVNVLGGAVFTPQFKIASSFLQEKLSGEYVKQGETVAQILAMQQAYNNAIHSVVQSGRNEGWWNTIRSVKDIPGFATDKGAAGIPITGEKVGKVLGHYASEPIPGTPTLAVGRFIDPKAVDIAFRDAFNETPLGKAVDGLGELVNWPSAMLRAGDKFSKGVHADMAARARAIREGYLDPASRDPKTIEQAVNKVMENRAMRDEIENVSKKETFTQDLKYGVPQQLQHPIAKVFIPFYQTPVNIFKYNLEGVPVLRRALEEVRNDLKAGGIRAEAANTKMYMTTAFMASVGGLAMGDVIKITGRGPDNPESKAVWLKDNKEYSIRVKNPTNGEMHFVSLAKIEPWGSYFGTVADLVNMSGDIDPDTYGEALAGGFASFTRMFSNKTFTKSSFELLDLFNPKSFEEAETLETRIENFMGKKAANLLVPSIVAGVARGYDPVLRDVKVQGDEWATFVNRLKARTPGWSKDLPPILDNIDGQPIVQEAGWSSALVDPFDPKQTTDDPTVKEIVRVKANYASPKRTLDGVALSPEQYRDIVTYFTQGRFGKRGNMREQLDALMSSDSYKWEDAGKTRETTDKYKALRIELIVKAQKAAATGAMYRQYPELKAQVFGEKRASIQELRNSSNSGQPREMTLSDVPVQVAP